MLMFRVDRKKVEAAKSCAEGKIHLFEDTAPKTALVRPVHPTMVLKKLITTRDQ